MNAQELWNRYKTPSVPRPRRGPDPGHQPDAVRRRLLRPAWSRRCRRRSPPWTRWRRGRSPTPTRSGWSATTGCAPRSWRPTPEIADEIRDTLAAIKAFAATCTRGEIKPPNGRRFTQRARRSASAARRSGRSSSPTRSATRGRQDAAALHRQHRPRRHRPRARAARRHSSPRRSSSSSRKSGGTTETRNGMLVAADAYKRSRARLRQARRRRHRRRARSSTSRREQEGWLARFPMWDWVGGRTSELSAVGLVPAALQGIDIDAHARRRRGDATRPRARTTPRKNPAALLALMWYLRHRRQGRRRTWSSCPTRIGCCSSAATSSSSSWSRSASELDLDGKRVNQGIAVYGNKGSTDQHAYVQQLRDGVNNFFVTFVAVLEDGGDARSRSSRRHAGDYLHGFLLGTREALYENDRAVDDDHRPARRRPDGRRAHRALRARRRASTRRSSNINAYHQPGVEAGKKAAAAVLELQAKVAGRALGHAPDRRRDRRGRSARRTTPRRSTSCSSTSRPTGGPKTIAADQAGADDLRRGIETSSRSGVAHRRPQRALRSSKTALESGKLPAYHDPPNSTSFCAWTGRDDAMIQTTIGTTVPHRSRPKPSRRWWPGSAGRRPRSRPRSWSATSWRSSRPTSGRCGPRPWTPCCAGWSRPDKDELRIETRPERRQAAGPVRDPAAGLGDASLSHGGRRRRSDPGQLRLPRLPQELAGALQAHPGRRSSISTPGPAARQAGDEGAAGARANCPVTGCAGIRSARSSASATGSNA